MRIPSFSNYSVTRPSKNVRFGQKAPYIDTWTPSFRKDIRAIIEKVYITIHDQEIRGIDFLEAILKCRKDENYSNRSMPLDQWLQSEGIKIKKNERDKITDHSYSGFTATDICSKVNLRYSTSLLQKGQISLLEGACSVALKDLIRSDLVKSSESRSDQSRFETTYLGLAWLTEALAGKTEKAVPAKNTPAPTSATPISEASDPFSATFAPIRTKLEAELEKLDKKRLRLIGSLDTLINELSVEVKKKNQMDLEHKETVATQGDTDMREILAQRIKHQSDWVESSQRLMEVRKALVEDASEEISNTVREVEKALTEVELAQIHQETLALLSETAEAGEFDTSDITMTATPDQTLKNLFKAVNEMHGSIEALVAIEDPSAFVSALKKVKEQLRTNTVSQVSQQEKMQGLKDRVASELPPGKSPVRSGLRFGGNLLFTDGYVSANEGDDIKKGLPLTELPPHYLSSLKTTLDKVYYDSDTEKITGRDFLEAFYTSIISDVIVPKITEYRQTRSHYRNLETKVAQLSATHQAKLLELETAKTQLQESIKTGVSKIADAQSGKWSPLGYFSRRRALKQATKEDIAKIDRLQDEVSLLAGALTTKKNNLDHSNPHQPATLDEALAEYVGEGEFLQHKVKISDCKGHLPLKFPWDRRSTEQLRQLEKAFISWAHDMDNCRALNIKTESPADKRYREQPEESELDRIRITVNSATAWTLMREFPALIKSLVGTDTSDVLPAKSSETEATGTSTAQVNILDTQLHQQLTELMEKRKAEAASLEGEEARVAKIKEDVDALQAALSVLEYQLPRLVSDWEKADEITRLQLGNKILLKKSEIDHARSRLENRQLVLDARKLKFELRSGLAKKAHRAIHKTQLMIEEKLAQVRLTRRNQETIALLSTLQNRQGLNENTTPENAAPQEDTLKALIRQASEIRHTLATALEMKHPRIFLSILEKVNALSAASTAVPTQSAAQELIRKRLENMQREQKEGDISYGISSTSRMVE